MKTTTLIAAAMTAASAAFATQAVAEPTTVRVASHVSELSPLIAQAKLFAAEVEKRHPGAFQFEFFPGGQLGKESALITNVKAGSIEMIIVASGVMKLDKKLGVFDLPWLFKDRDHVRRAMAAGLEDAVRARIEEVAPTVRVVGIYENGFRHVMNGVRPVSTPADLDGLKIRISGGKFRQEVFKSMGATPQKVAWKETFTALQTGVVDGAEAATYGFYGQKHYEVANHLSTTGHVYTPSFFLASGAFWDSLTDAQRADFAAIGREITVAAYELSAKLEADYFEEMKSRVEINAVDTAAFQAATASNYDDYVSSQGDDYLTFVRQTAE